MEVSLAGNTKHMEGETPHRSPRSSFFPVIGNPFLPPSMSLTSSSLVKLEIWPLYLMIPQNKARSLSKKKSCGV